jgi:hypothetical protein
VTPTVLEPIKTAIVAGDHARARALRTQLFRELIDEMVGLMVDPMNFIDGPPVHYLQSIESLVESTDSLGIQEEA